MGEGKRKMISLLDNDLYKLSMGQAVFFLFPRAVVRYTFINRGNTPFPKNFLDMAVEELNKIERVHLKSTERIFLQKECPWLLPPYLDFLSGYRFNLNEVKMSQYGDKLFVEIEGPWYRAIYWEVVLMSMISEAYFKATGQKSLDVEKLEEINRDKATMFEDIGAKFADFGTRRRFSFENHDRVVDQMKKYAPNSFVGTSNPYFAMKYGIKAIGTQAHEWYMYIAAMYGFNMANSIGMEKWVEMYQGSLGIALTDTFTTEVFFRDFGMKYAKLFDGVRQDSGNPIKFADRAIKHYRDLGIDSTSKSIVFSDSLDPKMVEEIHAHCKGKIKDAYGIGTNLTNDVGVKPLNIVIKLTDVMVEGNWVPTVKLSDDPGKHTGDTDTVDLCKRTLRLSA